MNPPSLSPVNKKLLLSGLAIVVALLSVTAGLDGLAARTPISRLDTDASAYYDGAVKKALATYAVARMLNAAISTVQGTELAVSPAGMGLSLSVGEVLDPINDLIERFSWVMLLSTVSLGIQSVLMEIGAWIGFRVLVSVSMVLLLAGLWIPRAGGAGLNSLAVRLLIVSVVVRFCIPVVGVTGQAIYNAFLADRYTESTENLEVIRGKVRRPIVQPEGEAVQNDGLLDQLRRKYEGTRETLNIQARLDALQDTVEAGIDHITSLMIVFLLQTIVLPLIVLWGLARLAGALFRTPARLAAGRAGAG
ncbi:MAG: hypothetical protein K9M82_04410 [Deltaproteobacteria bacterium]|nr:hypothetical protein [Deltaproteobacteria bacterium]